MELRGIEKALEGGCRLHAFRSGGGLRVVRLEKEGDLKGYGEHPLANDALVHANEDFLAGGRPYDEVYGKKHPHYLTGSSTASTELDQWMLQGRTFDAWWENDEIVVELQGLQDVRPPEELIEQVKKTLASAKWKNRGYHYVISPFIFPGNGKLGTQMKCLNPGKDTGYLTFNVTKTGRGKNFQEAMDNAFAALQVETATN